MSRLLDISYSSPPQSQNNVWQRLKANSISACFSRWKQYSHGLWVSSSFTFNCKVLIKRVGNLGVRLLRDCWKLRNWTQRGTGLKCHSSKTVLRSGPFFERDNVRIALLLQWVRLALKKKKEKDDDDHHHLPGTDNTLCSPNWTLLLPQQPEEGLTALTTFSQPLTGITCARFHVWPTHPGQRIAGALLKLKPKHGCADWEICSALKSITVFLIQTHRHTHKVANCYLHPG